MPGASRHGKRKRWLDAVPVDPCVWSIGSIVTDPESGASIAGTVLNFVFLGVRYMVILGCQVQHVGDFAEEGHVVSRITCSFSRPLQTEQQANLVREVIFVVQASTPLHGAFILFMFLRSGLGCWKAVNPHPSEVVTVTCLLLIQRTVEEGHHG